MDLNSLNPAQALWDFQQKVFGGRQTPKKERDTRQGHLQPWVAPGTGNVYKPNYRYGHPGVTKLAIPGTSASKAATPKVITATAGGNAYVAPAARDYRSGVATVISRRSSGGAPVAAKYTPAYGDKEVTFNMEGLPGNAPLAYGTTPSITISKEQQFDPAKNSMSAFAPSTTVPIVMGAKKIPDNWMQSNLNVDQQGVYKGSQLPEGSLSEMMANPNPGGQVAGGQIKGKLKDVWNQQTQQQAYLNRVQSGAALNTGSTDINNLAEDIGHKRIAELGGYGDERGQHFAKQDLMLRANRIKDPGERAAFLEKGRAAIQSRIGASKAQAGVLGGGEPTIKDAYQASAAAANANQYGPAFPGMGSNEKAQGAYNLAKARADSKSYGPAFPNQEVKPATVPAPPVGTANTGNYGNSPGGAAAGQSAGTLQPDGPAAPTTKSVPTVPALQQASNQVNINNIGARPPGAGNVEASAERVKKDSMNQNLINNYRYDRATNEARTNESRRRVQANADRFGAYLGQPNAFLESQL